MFFQVSSRLKKVNLAGKKLTLKVMVRRPDAPVNTIKFGGHGVCQSLSRSKAIPSYTNEPELIAAEVSRLMKSLRVSLNHGRANAFKRIKKFVKCSSRCRVMVLSFGYCAAKLWF